MNDDEAKRGKKPRFMRWYPEKWLDGSIREEMTAAQRGVWADLLCLGGRNDPPGQVDFTTTRSLARRLAISHKLLLGTLRSAVLNRKIRIIKVYVDPQSAQKFEAEEVTLGPETFAKKSSQPDQYFQKNEVTIGIVDTFVQKSSPIRVPLHAIIFLDWNSRQPPYYRQKPYPQLAEEPPEKASLPGPESDAMDRRGDIKGNGNLDCDRRQESPKNSSLSPLLSSPKKKAKTLKEEFLEMLRACRCYPFNEAEDSLLFDVSIAEHPEINILDQTAKKIAWWEDHPDAVKANPRVQLQTWFSEEAKFKDRGGPQKLGDIMPEVGDPDHRRFIAQYFAPGKKRSAPDDE